MSTNDNLDHLYARRLPPLVRRLKLPPLPTMRKQLGNPRSSGYIRVSGDFYQEGRYAIDALLDVEEFPTPVWDCACGEGNIPDACNARGIQAWGSDIVDRGYGEVADFFASSWTAESIITNPPFNKVELFIHHALARADKVAILARLAFLEGQRRHETLFSTVPPARVWIFSRRISMPPGGQGIEAKGGSMAFCWLVWEKSHVGKTELGWLA